MLVTGDVVYAQTWEILTLKKTHRATLIVIHRISTADCSPDDVTGCSFKCPKNNTGKVAQVLA